MQSELAVNSNLCRAVAFHCETRWNITTKPKKGRGSSYPNMDLLIYNSLSLIQNLTFDVESLPLQTYLTTHNRPAASYNERQLERHSSNDDQQDEEDQEPTNSSGRPTSDQMARMRLKRLSSSALCLNDGPTCDRGSATSGKQSRTNQTCGGGKKPPNERTSRKLTTSQQQAKGASESSSAQKTSKKYSASVTANSLAPIEDPIVQLARQRRPSVTNHGSVNVDQQGEFSR